MGLLCGGGGGAGGGRRRGRREGEWGVFFYLVGKENGARVGCGEAVGWGIRTFFSLPFYF